MGKDEQRNNIQPGEDKTIPTASFAGAAATPGGQIGPYKILSILGEGGYGIVYLAEQQKPVRRRVALKVIKPGMDTKEVIARFEAERQALALLDHPNIAHVYDAGTTEAGRPYFVMEYVKGVPIIEHCDRQKLTIEERLELFLDICEAIQHAHQKGIIHRDIKPSNILVLIEGKKAVPKVIDFGVAKAVSQPLTERTLVTEQGQFVGTPEYMSPEQAEMTHQDIDTRSDIYSLGVVLYELLTGVLPFDAKTLREGGVDHIRRVIREEEPKTPSTRLTRLGGESRSIAERRRTNARTLAKQLHTELEWIPLKAMRKEHTHRYQTASEFADDIKNYLNGSPLIAAPESVMYRLKKFVRRHRVPVTAVAFVAAAVMVGFVVSTTMYFRAEQARLRAEAQSYAGDMVLARQALDQNDIGRALDLLNPYRPKPREKDLRGWEWRYLWERCRGDELGTIGQHNGIVQSVAVSPDGQWVASGGWDGLLKIWTLGRGATGWQEVTNLQLGGGSVCSVAFSPDGRWLAAGTWANGFTLLKVPGWQREWTETNMETGFISFAFSPDSQLLAVGGEVWSMDTHTRLRTLPCRKFTWGEPVVAWLPNSEMLAGFGMSKGDYQVSIFDVRSTNTDATVSMITLGKLTCPTTLAFSPDGRHLAVGCWGGTIHIFAAEDWREVKVLTNHTAWVSSLAFSKDGQLLASASADHRIKVWCTRDWQETSTLRGHLNEVWAVAFTPDGQRLVTGSKDDSVRLWPVAGKSRPVEEVSVYGDETSAFRLSGVCPFRFGPSNILTVWDEQTLQIRQQISSYPITNVIFGRPSPDARLLCMVTDEGGLWLMGVAEAAGTRPVCLQTSGPLPDAGVFSDRTNWLAVADGKVLRVWNLKCQPPLLALAPAVGKVWLLNFSHDERFLSAVTGANYTEITVLVWDVASGKEMARLQPHHDFVSGLDFSPDSTVLATVSYDNTCKLFDLQRRREITTLRGLLLALHSVCFSPDGRRLAAGTGEGGIIIWDLETGREVLVLKGHRDPVSAVCFDSSGNALLSSDGITLRLWRAPSWAEIEAAEKRLESGQSP